MAYENSPPPERWSQISADLSQAMEFCRRSFFDQCIVALKQTGATIVMPSLGGRGSHAIKAFQLYFVSRFLAQHQYIPPNQGRDFADLLYAQVCGPELLTCLELMRQYHETEHDPGTQLFRFSSDVARYIGDSDAPIEEAMVVAVVSKDFVALTHVAVAETFGDRATIAILRSQITGEPSPATAPRSVHNQGSTGCAVILGLLWIPGAILALLLGLQ